MKLRRARLYLILVGLVSGTFLASLALQAQGWCLRWENVGFHAAGEAAGALTVLIMAYFLLRREEPRGERWKTLLVALGFLGMGLLDGFHSVSLPGHGSIFLRSVASLVGGFWFALVWLPEPRSYGTWRKWAPWIVVAASGLFGIFSLVFAESLPRMMHDGQFTGTAVALNVTGGVLFVAASVRLFLDFRRSNRMESCLLSIMAILLGLAGLVFAHSTLWDEDWWFWHFARLAAYLVAVGFVLEVPHRTVSDLKAAVAEQQRSDAALRDVQMWFKDLVETLYDWVWEVNVQGYFTYVSPRVKEVLGYEAAELLGKTPLDLMPPEEVLRVGEIFSSLTKSQKPIIALENIGLHKDGHPVVLETSGLPFRDAEGNFKGYRGIDRDITERKRATTALRESEERYRRITEGITDYWYTMRVEDGRTTYGAGCEKVTGYTAEELVDPNLWMSIVPEEDRDRAIEHVRGVYERKESMTSEHRIVRKDGKIAWVSVTTIPRVDPQGNLLSCDGVLKDITESKQQMDALTREKDQAKTLLNLYQLPESSLQDFSGFIIGECIKLTKSQLAFFGFINEDETLMSAHVWSEKAMENCAIDNKPVEFSIGHAGIWAEAIREHRPIIVNDYQKPGSRKKGYPEGHVPISCLLSVPIVEKGRAVALVAVANKMQDYNESDILHLDLFIQTAWGILKLKEAEENVRKMNEDRQRMEVHFRQSQRMEAIATLAGGIAHDFNNILTVILGNADMGLAESPETGRARYTFEQITTAGYRARDLVKQILDFSRQTEQERRPVRVSSIVKEVVKFLMASLPTTIRIQPQIAVDRDTVLADPTQIHQVLMNLCTNAHHAMLEQGGVLGVTLNNVDIDSEIAAKDPDLQPGSYLKLTLSDTGCGMTPEVMARIFDPYFTTKGRAAGTGLGLAVVHGIIKTFNGGITVQSEPEKGSTFEIFLPLIEDKTISEVQTYEAIPRGKERVLFVDDDATIADLGKRMLEHLGYEVEVRTSGIEALEVFKAQPDKFDVVITDITMPKMTGDRLARELIAIRPGIPVILCTGYSERMTDWSAREMAIKGYVMKPMVMRELASAIRNALE